MSVVLGVVISVVTGVASSAIFWWLQFRVFRTRLQVSSTIARYESTAGWRSQVKIRNAAKRDAIDVAVTIRARLPDLIREGSTEVLTLGAWERPILSAGEEVQYAVRPEHMPEWELRRFEPHLPAEIVDAARRGQPIDLPAVLSLGNGATLDVFVFGTDASSGARGYATASVPSDGIRAGRFVPGSFEHMVVSASEAPPATDQSSTPRQAPHAS